jgi:hypothetical protein
MLMFLYGRGFMSGANKSERVQRVKEIVNNNKEDVAERLLQVLALTGDNDLMFGESIDKYTAAYERHVLTLKRYFRLENTVGFLENMDKAKFYFRFRKSGNCFLQGPCVLVSYLMQKRAEQNKDLTDFSPLDVSKYVRHTFSDNMLYEYVVKDSGGKAIEELQTILRHARGEDGDFAILSLPAASLRKESVEWVKDLLQKNGPGLVTKFRCSKVFEQAANLNKDNQVGIIRFSNPGSNGEFVPLSDTGGAEVLKHDEDDIKSTISHYSETSSAKRRLCPPEQVADKMQALETKRHKQQPAGDHTLHAMVLLGMRIDERNPKKKYFLFQNWWEGMPLVEVSDDYLYKEAKPLVAFVHPDYHECFDSLQKDNFDCARNGALLAECNDVDRAERSFMERIIEDPDSPKERASDLANPCLKQGLACFHFPS